MENHIRACKAQKAMNHMLHACMNMLPILVNCNTYISEFNSFWLGKNIWLWLCIDNQTLYLVAKFEEILRNKSCIVKELLLRDDP